jgi:hypothetical protein
VIEFSVPHSAEKCIPFAWGEPENGPFDVFAVANADFVIGQACYLDAVTVGEAEGTLNPA